MAIKIQGTTIIDNSLNLANTASITFGDATAQTTAASGGGVGEVVNSAGQLLHTLDNPNPMSVSAGDFFAASVAIDGNYAIVSASEEHELSYVDSGKVYIFNAKTGELIYHLHNPNAYSSPNDDSFGGSVAISGNYAIVGARWEDDAGGSASGKAYIFNVTTGALVHTLDNPNAYNTSANDYFGFSVGISGNYAIVGAYGEDDAGGSTSGKAYIFNVTTGALVHTLDNPNAYSTSAGDYFSQSVGISGNYAIIGTYSEDDAGGVNSGKAYIFNVATGALVHTLDNPNAYNTSGGDVFGKNVAISGNYAIVSAHLEDDAGGADSGKAYIFNVTTGTLVHTLDNPNAYSTSVNDYFGDAVSISGNYAIVGAYAEDDASGGASGKAYIFDVTTGDLLRTLDNPNAYGTAEQDYFGRRVAISDTYAIVGAFNEDDAGGTNSGKAYIFAVDKSYRMNGIKEITFDNGLKLESSSKLFETAHVQGELLHTLDNPNPYGAGPSTSLNDRFGYGVGISGNYAIASAHQEDDASGTDSGKAYIYDVTTGALLHTLDNPNAYSTSTDDDFGFSVAISDNYAIVGAFGEDDAGGNSSGKAYIFKATTGELVHTLDNPNAYNTSASDLFGRQVAISGNYAIVGAYAEDDAGGSSSGKAYIFNVTTGALLHTLDNPTGYSTSPFDQFGISVAISGNYAIVGANGEGDAGGSGSGKAYIFDVPSGALIHTLDNPNAYSTSGGDNFGGFVAISGNYAIVSATQERDAAGTQYSGVAYIFNVTTGDLVHTLDNPNPDDDSYLDLYGSSVTISGNYAVVGAYREDDAGGADSGKAYIYDVTTGALVHTLANPNAYSTSASDNFSTVAISGNYVIVGAYGEDDADGGGSGKAYIFSATNQTYLDKIVNLIP